MPLNKKKRGTHPIYYETNVQQNVPAYCSPPLSRLMRVNGTPETIIANILCNNGTAISNSANKNQQKYLDTDIQEIRERVKNYIQEGIVDNSTNSAK